jgi:hypothetical protein
VKWRSCPFCSISSSSLRQNINLLVYVHYQWLLLSMFVSTIAVTALSVSFSLFYRSKNVGLWFRKPLEVRTYICFSPRVCVFLAIGQSPFQGILPEISNPQKMRRLGSYLSSAPSKNKKKFPLDVHGVFVVVRITLIKCFRHDLRLGRTLQAIHRLRCTRTE